jgi:hypothetical protein
MRGGGGGTFEDPGLAPELGVRGVLLDAKNAFAAARVNSSG